jgi:CRISPR-associated protein Csm1
LKKTLYEARKAVNTALLDRFDGAVFFGLGLAPVTAAMFAEGRMSDAWKTAAEDLDRDRTTRFQDLMDEDFFAPQIAVNPALSCSACGSRKMDSDREKCRTCSDLETLGMSLKNANAILTTWDETERDRIRERLNAKKAFAELGATVFLLRDHQLADADAMTLRDADCTLLNRNADQPFQEIPLPGCAISALHIGRWEAERQVHPDGEPWDFEDYANHSGGGEDQPGLPRLGVLRMDVDNLGLVFIQGLQFPEREGEGQEHRGWGDVIRDQGKIRRRAMASISRMATLSRQLNHFFSAYVPRLLEEPEFDRCQVIYAGGDDLFVIGSWDQLPGLARRIRHDFKAFCCGNPAFSISGGIILQRGKYPIYKGAQRAGNAESTAKTVRGEWVGVQTGASGDEAPLAAWPHQKDGFTFLGVPILWEDFRFCAEIRDELVGDMAENRGLLGYLARMAAENRLTVNGLIRSRGLDTASAWNEIAYAPWRWQTAYQLKRRYRNDNVSIRRWSNILFGNRFGDEKTGLPVYSWLEMPVRWTDYLNRTKGGK